MNIIFITKFGLTNLSNDFQQIQWMTEALNQCSYSNPNSTIHIITNKKIESDGTNIKYYDIESYGCNDIKKFRQSYVHLNTTPIEFEKVCFERWFILKDFLSKHNLSDIYYGDFDSVIFEDLQQEKDKFKQYSVTISDYHCSATMFINDYKFVNDLSDNILNSYLDNDKKLFNVIQYHKNRNYKRGGVCDMTFINEMLLSGKYSDALGDISSKTRIDLNGSYDNNFTTVDNWDNEIKLGTHVKKIYKENKHVYGTYKNQKIKFITLHFFSNFKHIIKDYVTYK